MMSEQGSERRFIVHGRLHAADFEERTITIKVAAMPPLKAGDYAIVDSRELLEIIATNETLRGRTVSRTETVEPVRVTAAGSDWHK
jgi:hypothetical protein